MRRPAAFLLLILGLIAVPLQAQPEPTTPEAIQEAAIEAFLAGDLDAAERHLRHQLELEPDNFVPHYNLACVHAGRDDLDRAADELERAIELGFIDIVQLTRDPHLAPLHSTPRYERIVKNWDKILDARAGASLDAAKDRFGPEYTFHSDELLRLTYASAYTDVSTAEAQEEITRVFAWAYARVFSSVHEAMLARQDAWVMVILPTQGDFLAWAVRTYGRSARQNLTAIGGHYSHDAKELWAADLGATLRHEAFHILHWRSSTRLGQMHAVWMQEGLASLVESIDVTDDGEIKIMPCWRTNQVKFLARAGRLPSLEAFCTMPRERFTSGRALANYAQARALFMWINEQDKLDDFYKAYVEGYRDDPMGYKALCTTLGMEGRELDLAFRAWARELPSVPEEVRPGTPSLGIDIEAMSTGEGLEVIGFAPRRSAGGLRMGDVITHLDGKPVRDYYELVRRLAACANNQSVDVRYRRGREHHTTTIILSPAG